MATYITLSCDHCSKSFEKEARKHRYELKLNPDKKTFCGRECHAASFSTTETFNCENCQKEITKAKDKNCNHHFCSHNCAASFSNKKRAENGFTNKAKKKEADCIKCNQKILIGLNASAATAVCTACIPTKVFKNGPVRLREFQCVRCNTTIQGYKRRKYCDPCYKIMNKETSKAAGIASAASQQRRSKNEIYFAELCASHFTNANITTNEPFFIYKTAKKETKWDADVIIHDFKIAILWNGAWHYKQISKKQSLKQVQNRDKLKVACIKANGYTPFIIKDMGKHDKKFVEKQFKRFLKWFEKL